MIRTEYNARTLAQVYCNVSMGGTFDLSWPTGHKVLNVSGSAQVSQSSPQLLRYSESQVAFRLGLALTELPELFIGKGEFQCRDDIGFFVKRQQVLQSLTSQHKLGSGLIVSCDA